MTDDPAGRIGPRTLLLLVVIGACVSVALGSLVVPTGNVNVDDGVPLRASNGFTLTIDTGTGEDLQSGSPFTASNTIAIGNLSIAGPPAGAANLTLRNDTDMALGDVSGGTVIVNDSQTSHAYGADNVDDVVFSRALDLDQSASGSEIAYASSTAPDLEVRNTGLQQGRGVIAEQPNGNILDAAAVDSGGDVRFDELPSGAASLNVKKGASVLKIFNKSAPSTLVTEAIRVRFFDADGDLVRENTTTTGKVDLNGLDQSDAYTVQFRDTDDTAPNYLDSSIVLNELIDQTNVYLPPKNGTDLDRIVFELDDRTGDFPGGQTDLKIEELITKDFDGDGNPETEYRDVSGERFGSDNTATLLLTSGETFRLQIRNEDTDSSRLLGNYQTAGNDTVTLTVSEVRIDSDSDVDRGFAIDAGIINKSGTRFIKVNYRDVESETSELNYLIEFRKNGSAFATGQIDGPLGNTSFTESLAGHPDNLSYIVRYNIDRDGENEVGKILVGQTPNVGIPLDQRWLGILGILGIVAIGGLLVIIDDSVGALGMVVTAALFTAIGITSIPSAAIGMAGGIAVLAVIGRRG